MTSNRIRLVCALLLVLVCVASLHAEIIVPEGVEITETNLWTPFVETLRIRETPDLNGKVITTIKLGEQVEYIETSKNTSTVDFNGEKITDSWIKVRMKDGKIGWAWKGFMVRLIKYCDKIAKCSILVPYINKWGIINNDFFGTDLFHVPYEERYKSKSQLSISINRESKEKYMDRNMYLKKIHCNNNKIYLELEINGVESIYSRYYNLNDNRDGYTLYLGYLYDNKVLVISISTCVSTLVENINLREYVDRLFDLKYVNKIFEQIESGNGTYEATKWYSSMRIICKTIKLEDDI